MIFTDQSRSCHPERSEGSDWVPRSFAALRMTGHDRCWSLKFIRNRRIRSEVFSLRIRTTTNRVPFTSPPPWKCRERAIHSRPENEMLLGHIAAHRQPASHANEHQHVNSYN